MADVWLAEDQELGRKVAIKMLHERYANDTQFVERFRREATHAAGLSHPNVVSIFDRGEADGSYYIVMEYVEGRTLKELLVTRGPCPVPVAISYVRQVLAALRYAHRNGIVHRDIKPHNVLVDHEGRVKVADFGIARAGSSQMTEAGSIIGTAQYLSPEQARGAPVDESSDLYSTGIVLYELLTGDVPFNGETPVEIAMKHLSQVPSAPSSIRSEIPRDLDLVVLRALAKEPAERYRSAKEMDRDLELVGRGDPSAPRPRPPRRWCSAARRPPRRPSGRCPRAYGGDERYARTKARYAPAARGGRGSSRSGRPSRSAWSAGSSTTTPRPDRRKRANCGRQLHRHPRGERRRPDRRRRVRGQGRPAPPTATSSPVRLPAGSRPGTRQPKGRIVTVLVSIGKPKVTVPVVVGKTRDTAVAELTSAASSPVVEVNSQRPSGIVTAQEPPGRPRRPRLGVLREDQRLQGAEARGRAERGRLELRGRGGAAPVGRVHGRTRLRWRAAAPPGSRRAKPAGQLDGVAGLVGHPLGLAGAHDRARPRRLAADSRRRARDSPCGFGFPRHG